ncbi:MAG: Na+/H+ antiporter NhaC [Opitutales bacterium]|nr:Na+/H+ antiporter NhaC [Opitutales bacterium]
MEPTSSSDTQPPHPLLWQALIPVVFLVAVLAVVVIWMEGDVRVPIILATVVAAFVGLAQGVRWLDMQHGIVQGIVIGLPSILILMLVGSLIGTWIAGGIVPLMIYAGLEVFSPQGFLPAAAFLCAIVSLATGSSWTTAGSVGVALVGVGTGLGVNPAMTAGAIVSGAYFGDKMSPLSDSTNLAPAVAGADLFAHIRHMFFTTGPSFLIALAGFAILGLAGAGGGADLAEVAAIQSALKENFSLSPWLWLVPMAVLVMVSFKVPAMPALFVGSVLGALSALFIERRSFELVMGVINSGFVSETGQAMVDKLLSNGGIDSMMWTISLILCALSFGGVMERTGQLRAIGVSILAFAKGRGSLVASTGVTSIITNFLAADQYLALIFPGRMFKGAYEKMKLAPVNLSRALEDMGTLSSPLIPWNTCGVTMAGVLGVATGEYWIFALFNLINPVVSILYGFTGWTMKPAEAPKEKLPV